MPGSEISEFFLNILSQNRKWIPNMAEKCQGSNPKIKGFGLHPKNKSKVQT